MTSEDENRCLGKCHSGALRKMDQGDASHLDTVHSPRAASFAPSTGGPPGRKHRGTPAKQASGAHSPGQEELLSGRGSPRFLSSGGARVKDTRVPAPRSERPDLQASPPHAELNADPLNPGSQPAPSTPRRPAAGKPATAPTRPSAGPSAAGPALRRPLCRADAGRCRPLASGHEHHGAGPPPKPLGRRGQPEWGASPVQFSLISYRRPRFPGTRNADYRSNPFAS